MKRLAATTLILCAATPSLGAFNAAWDYAGNNRSLQLNFAADTRTTFVNVGAPQREFDPTGADAFSIADAVTRAADAWSSAGTGWTVSEFPAAAGSINIDVRFGRLVADPVTGAPKEFDQFPSNEQRGSNDRPVPVPGGGGGLSPALAFFNIISTDPMDARFVTRAEIVFNPSVLWGIGTNGGGAIPGGQPAAEDMFYDPIIVALHEIGHAFRLEHVLDAGSDTIGAPRDGSVMREFTAAGWHQTNLNMLFARNPSANDLAMANMSANNQLPTPGVTTTLALAALTATRRRRK